ncbi:MAG TPA: hypothetical protein VE907_15880 [Gammaproteobacteria bacterium]|nr:hypothetical protein [Gammaproteobacteria bacterium]
MPDLSVARITTGTVYRLTFVGLLFGCVPLFAVLGVLGYFGITTLQWNDQPLTGMRSLVAGPFIGAFFAAVFGAFAGTVGAFGLWLYSRFAPLTIRYESHSSTTS